MASSEEVDKQEGGPGWIVLLGSCLVVVRINGMTRFGRIFKY